MLRRISSAIEVEALDDFFAVEEEGAIVSRDERNEVEPFPEREFEEEAEDEEEREKVVVKRLRRIGSRVCDLDRELEELELPAPRDAERPERVGVKEGVE